MDNQFDTYLEMLNGGKVSIATDVIYSGYYRIKDNGKWKPVAIYNKEDGSRYFRVGSDTITDEDKQWSKFTWAVKNPMKIDDVRYAMKYGFWPDDVEASLPSANVDGQDTDDASRGIGHNSGDSTAREKLRDAMDVARDFSKTPASEIDKLLANKSANLDAHIVKLEKAVKAEREANLGPLTQAVKDLDKRRDDLVQQAKQVRTDLDAAKKVSASAAVEWATVLDSVKGARELCKGVYVSWQRQRSLETDDPKELQVGGGDGSSRKGYTKSNDPLHPDNIQAAKDIERAKELLELEKRQQAEREKLEAELKAKELRRIEQEARDAAAAADAAAKVKEIQDAEKEAVKPALTAGTAQAPPTSAPGADDVETLEQVATTPAESGEIIGATILDWTAATLNYSDHPRIRDVVRSLAMADLKSGKTIEFADPVYDTAFGGK